MRAAAPVEGDRRCDGLLLEVPDWGDGVMGARFGEKVVVNPTAAAAAAPGPRLRELAEPPPLPFTGTPSGRLPKRAARSAASASQKRCCC